jgi:uncharacterized membrane protein YgaE (UPF0421/DUF939 family)
LIKIGYRTVKTALGTTIAVMISQALQLENYISAGIITILCIKATKKQSLKSSWDRFAACLVAMGISYIVFEGIMYHPIMIGLMLLIFIPITVQLKITEGIITSSVIIFHLYNSSHITLKVIGKEILLILIGIGIALLMNLYMPSAEKKLKGYIKEIEENFAAIFKEIEFYLRNPERVWDGREITKVSQLLKDAKRIAIQDIENHLLKSEDSYYHYFAMREKQFEIINRIIFLVTSIQVSVEQSKIVADFIRDIRTNIHSGNTAYKFIHQLQQMRKNFKQMDLPKTREEFEARAALVQFVKEMELYLMIKMKFKGIQ